MESELPKKESAAAYDLNGELWHSLRGAGHRLLEKPAILELTGSVLDKSVLCVGCVLVKNAPA